MKTMTLLLFLFAQPAESQVVTDLFDVLDADGNGVVEPTEISESQKPYFLRALRVSDHNEDGALTRDELTKALTDPKPVELTSQNRRGSFDPKVFDRNNDGVLSKTEIPAALQERMKRLFEQYGDSIPIKVLQDLRNSQTPSTRRPPNSAEKDAKETPSMEMSVQSSRLAGLLKRYDVNDDGKLNARELRSAPAGLKALDRNRDGEISKTELAIISRSDDSRENSSRMMEGDRMSKRGASGQRPTAANAEQFFRRLDRNGDERLTGDEIPQRLRQAVRRADRNEDKAIDLQEFRRAVEYQPRGK